VTPLSLKCSPGILNLPTQAATPNCFADINTCIHVSMSRKKEGSFWRKEM
jgi:hypothetical protein